MLRPREGDASRRVFVVAFATLSLLGLSWALASPLMSVPDEPAHAIKAASVARLQIDPPTAPIDGTFGHTNGTVSKVRLPLPYGALHTMPLCMVFRHEPATCLEPLPPPERVVETATTAGTYPPGFYALVGWPSLVLPTANAVYAMRIVSALICAALFASGLATLHRLTRSAAAVAAGFVGITPMALFLAGSVNPNGLEIAAAFAFWAGGLALLVSPTVPTSRDLVRVGVPVVLLAWSRPLSAGMAGVALVLVLFAAARWERIRQLAADRQVRRAALGAAGLVVLAVAYVLVNDSLGSFNGTADPTMTPRRAASQSWHLTNYRIDQLIGQFGWLEFSLPGEVLVAWQAATIAVLSLALALGTWRERLAIVAVAVTVLLLPVASEVASADEIGFAWQGRYSLPIAVGGLVLAAGVLGRHVAGRPRLDLAVAVLVVAPLAGAHLAAHATSMRRYVEATITPLFSYLGDTDGWEAPLGNTALLVLTTVAASGLLMTVLAAHRSRGTEVQVPELPTSRPEAVST